MGRVIRERELPIYVDLSELSKGRIYKTVNTHGFSSKIPKEIY